MEYLIGDQIEGYRNGSLLQFSRPCDRGFINNWQCEVEVWSYLFHERSRIKPADTSLVMTEAPLNLPTIQNDTNEVVFEYFSFKEYFRRPAIWFSNYGAVHNPLINSHRLPGSIVVDSGFSFTHVAPFINDKCQKHAVIFAILAFKFVT